MCRSLVSKKLYIDDTSIAEAINLQLATVPAHNTYSPKGRMNSCGLAIPGCLTALQHRLRDMNTVAQAQGMVLNTKKTNIICFNTTDIYQAAPFISIDDESPLLCVAELRLLGLVLDQRLTWWPLVNDIVSRSKSRLWALIRLRDRGATVSQLLDTYIARKRSILETTCPAWSALISGVQTIKLEAVQRQALTMS